MEQFVVINGEKLENAALPWRLKQLLQMVSKILLLAVFVNDTQQAVEVLVNYFNYNKWFSYDCLILCMMIVPIGCVLIFIRKLKWIGFSILGGYCVLRCLYDQLTNQSDSFSAGFLAFTGSVLMVFGIELEPDNRNTSFTNITLQYFPKLDSREGLAACGQALARLAFCALSIDHSITLSKDGSHMFFSIIHLALILPILFGFWTRMFAIATAISMWAMFWYTIEPDAMVRGRYELQFKLCQAISNTGGLLALSLHGPGSFSVDEYQQKRY